MLSINRARESSFAVSTTNTTMASPLATLSMLLVSQLFVLGSQGTVVADIDAVESTPEIRTSTLPEGYVAHPDIGAAYKVHDASVSWIEARDNCIREGAKLAVIDSDKKLEYAKLQPMGIGVRHVGIHRVDGNWVSVTNEPISTSTIPWAEGEDEPDSEDYLFAMIGWSDAYTKLMNGRSSFSGDYICEIPLQQ